MITIRTAITSAAVMAMLASPLTMEAQNNRISDTTVILDARNTTAAIKTTKDAIDSLGNKIAKGRKALPASILVMSADDEDDDTFQECETESVSELPSDESWFGNDDDGEEAVGKILAVVLLFACVIPLGIALVALVIVMLFIRSDRARRARLIELSIRNNQPLPPEFYSRPHRRIRLQSGLMWVAWGLGLMIFFYYGTSSTRLAAMMFIPTLIGVAKILTYYLIDRKA